MGPEVKDPEGPCIHLCWRLTSVGNLGGPKRKHLPFLSSVDTSPFSLNCVFSHAWKPF